MNKASTKQKVKKIHNVCRRTAECLKRGFFLQYIIQTLIKIQFILTETFNSVDILDARLSCRKNVKGNVCFCFVFQLAHRYLKKKKKKKKICSRGLILEMFIKIQLSENKCAQDKTVSHPPGFYKNTTDVIKSNKAMKKSN